MMVILEDVDDVDDIDAELPAVLATYGRRERPNIGRVYHWLAERGVVVEVATLPLDDGPCPTCGQQR